MKKRYMSQLLAGSTAMLVSTVLYADINEQPVSSDGSMGAAPAQESEGVRGFAASAGAGISPQEAGANITPLTESEIEAIKALPALEGKVPDEFAAPPSPESIINRDTRSKVDPYDSATENSFPARAVVLMTMDQGRCTGTMINRNTVATAGHCVHSGGTAGSWSTNVVVYPGYTGTAAPYGSCNATALYSVTGWTVDDDWNYDYGAIKLDCNVGSATGSMGMRTVNVPLREPTIINGYPGDKPLEQWMGADRGRAYTATKIWYANDTAGGMSGSAIWGDSGKTRDPLIIGIHAYAQSANGYNSGTRLTAARIANYVYWRGL